MLARRLPSAPRHLRRLTTSSIRRADPVVPAATQPAAPASTCAEVKTTAAPRSSIVENAFPVEAVKVRRPVGGFRGGIFGFLLGFSLASGYASYQLLDEYKNASAQLQASVEELHRSTAKVSQHIRRIEEVERDLKALSGTSVSKDDLSRVREEAKKIYDGLRIEFLDLRTHVWGMQQDLHALAKKENTSVVMSGVEDETRDFGRTNMQERGHRPERMCSIVKERWRTERGTGKGQHRESAFGTSRRTPYWEHACQPSDRQVMAFLDKLAIRGIRSFDDKSVAIIEFYSPVTVIVGHNGSGKTTIIECLKYITTGDQPPNTRGGAFVHDPKMANEKEVKAQVRLRFYAANGTRMLATRNLSVTQKKTGLTMKTLEGILGTADEARGKRSTISTKCAEMDIEIPRLLGVSKSVLENVIFCHQEESYWPLAEPAALKKKFDDIFEATKYTKALDSIKSLRKDRVADLKAEKEKLESLKLEKNRASKLRTQIGTLQTAIGDKEAELERLTAECEQLALSNQRFYENAVKFKETLTRVEYLTKRKEDLVKNAESLHKSIKEIVDDEDIGSKIKSFEQRMSQQESRRAKLTEDLNDELERLQVYRRKHADGMTAQGRLMAEKEAYSRQIATREDLIHDIASKRHLRGFEHGSLDNAKIEDFTRRLQDLLAAQNTQTLQLKNQSRTRLEELDSRLRKLSNERASNQQVINDAQKDISKLKQDVDNFTAQIDSSRMVDAELRRVGAELQSEEEKQSILHTASEATNFDRALAERNKEIRDQQDAREKLERERQGLMQQADTRARLSSRQQEMKRRRDNINTWLSSMEQKFEQAVGHKPEENTMEGEISQAIREKEAVIAEEERTSTNAVAKYKQIESSKSRLQQDLQGKKDFVQTQRRRINEGKGDFPNIPAAVDFKTEELEQVKNDVAETAATISLFNKIRDIGVKSHKCRACDRPLTDAELPAFQRHISRLLEKLNSPEAQKENEVTVNKLMEDLRKLQDFQRDEEELNKLESVEIPIMARELNGVETSLESAILAADEAESRLKQGRASLRDLQSLKLTAAQVTTASSEIADIQRDIDQLMERLSIEGTTRSMEELETDLNTVNNRIKICEQDRQDLTAEKDRTLMEQRSLERRIHDLQLRQRDLQDKVKERTSLEQRVKDSKEAMLSKEKSIEERRQAVSRDELPLRNLERERAEFEKTSIAEIEESVSISNELEKNVERLRTANAPIELYIRERKDRQLDAINQEIGDMETHITEANTAAESIRASVALLDKEVGEQSTIMSNLRDNVRLRETQQGIAEVEAEIATHDLESMAKARRSFEDKYSLSKEKEALANSKRSHIGGEVTSMKAQLRQLQDDLTTDYKDIDKRYTDQLITVKMSDLVNNDLEKYAKALDNAIMRYHGLKMEEVNDTMKHLWNRTYQGTDIDGIKIRSDVEGGATRRTYNYRVVMTKDQVEMDMRGRCSAGQKMLASIIIRLALSDSFGQNCGILALDEPTNALDAENVEALAASLADLINERRNAANFQLIVITHDEKFLQKLASTDVMEFYWRVSRDAKQKSVIERNRIQF
ncbi:hypothetical protein DACRYDRAFT_101755 [Dacryopinax primogenitus]|uniref:DNA repair protein RAD50 n=1 Tax=Dacryopinax primogenitus (strain DJM 731) TaxID=1858805 RepID=M5G4P5_DACPD|nr:uncharacterized protein DACRYDRAFT_101755 [Dacryopinax primogenitus]EJT98707.1 hypothetical protein DACRYDRAFT_101755 [Dacryopinax primogenitus]